MILNGTETESLRDPATRLASASRRSVGLSGYAVVLLNACREAVRAQLIRSQVIGEDAYVVVAGPANTYAHYVTTREEYAVQRYEGASTLFGPCTLFKFTSVSYTSSLLLS